MIGPVRLSYSVPFCAQIASPELAERIFVQGLDPRLDPRWAESGAATPEEYAYWVDRACGAACLKMCVEALGGPRRALVDWARAGLAKGGYRAPVGWVHGALAELAREVGLCAEARAASLEEIVEELRLDHLVIASISHEAGDARLPITKQGGHLMVVVGAECGRDGPSSFRVHNPSGRRPEWQAQACLPVARFAAAYSGRIIVIARA